MEAFRAAESHSLLAEVSQAIGDGFRQHAPPGFLGAALLTLAP